MTAHSEQIIARRVHLSPQLGEIDIALSRPLAADPHAVNPRTGRVVLEMKGRISGGGLILSLDVDEKPRPRQAPGASLAQQFGERVELRLAEPARRHERAGRHR